MACVDACCPVLCVCPCVFFVHPGVAQFVRNAFEGSISGILNKRQVDVLHDIKRKRAKGEPNVHCTAASGACVSVCLGTSTVQ